MTSAKLPQQTEGQWHFEPSLDTAHAYRYVWIWKIPAALDAWYANVAEVQFYGWTQKDIDDSGLVIPPDAVTLARVVRRRRQCYECR